MQSMLLMNSTRQTLQTFRQQSQRILLLLRVSKSSSSTTFRLTRQQSSSSRIRLLLTRLKLQLLKSECSHLRLFMLQIWRTCRMFSTTSRLLFSRRQLSASSLTRKLRQRSMLLSTRSRTLTQTSSSRSISLRLMQQSFRQQ